MSITSPFLNYDGRLKKEEWIVRPVLLSTARVIVEKWHYAQSATNTGVYKHGLFRKGHDFFETDCLGVAWWLPPTKNAAIATYPEGDWRKVLSLTRLAIAENYLDENNNEVKTPKNACSFLLARSMRMINTDAWECLVTYADTWRGHAGTIYKATNWEYMGLTKPSPVFVNEDGKMMGRKRGGRNIKKSDLILSGFKDQGAFPKHKFRVVIKK